MMQPAPTTDQLPSSGPEPPLGGSHQAFEHTAPASVDLGIASLFTAAWGRFRKHPTPFLLSMLVFFGFYGLIFGVQVAIQTFAPGAGSADTGLRFGVAAVDAYLSVGLWRMCLNAVRAQNVEIGQLFSGSKLTPQKFLLDIAMRFGTVLGLMACVIPGCFVIARYSFAALFMVDQGHRTGPATKASWELTTGRGFRVFGTFLILLCLNLLGACLFLLPVFVTLPLSMLVMTEMYCRLTGTGAPTTADIF